MSEQLFYEAMLAPADADPYVGYRKLREAAPVLLTGDGVLVLSEHAGCDDALRHRGLGKGDETLGFQFTNISAETTDRLMERVGSSMIFSNPPDHTRLRRLVSDQFTGRHVQALREAIERRADDLLGAIAADPDGADFVTGVALPLPLQVIADLLGVPEDQREPFFGWTAGFAALTSPNPTAEALTAAMEADTAATAYFEGLIKAKRRDPGDDLLTRLAVAQDEDRLTDAEVISTALLLFGAGFETTTHLLANGLAALLADPDQLRRLQADPSLVPTAVEEFLRYDPPVQIDARTALEPATVAGVEVEPGQMVITLIAAANRDPLRFTDPDSLDIGRKDNGHLAFAAGPHFCLGAHLARLEGQVVFNRLVTAYARIAPAGPAVRRPGLALRGHARVPVTLS